VTEREADLVAHEAAEAAWGHSEPEPRLWVRGAWSAERRGDELADISFDGTTVLRMIRAVVRDRDWNTLPVAVASVDDDEDGLRLGLRFEGFDGRFDGVLTLRTVEGALDVRLQLEALQDFERNRIGLVVLHPPTVAGAELTVTSPDGAVTRTAFPEQIAPHQPAFDIAALHWTSDGVQTVLEFTGEVFEMEDQRNWTDASFKTYSTPLSLPFPVLVGAGERIQQGITLRAARVASPAAAPSAPRVTFRESGLAVPEIAVGASTAAGQVPDAARTTPGSTVLVELVAGTRNWRAALGRAIDEAAERRLDVRIVAASADDVEAALDALAGTPARVARLGVFSPGSQITEPPLWAALREGAERRGLQSDLVGGARSHFTELNRRHQDLPDDLPALTFSITPQMHATERAQLVESIGMQRLVAENAVRIAAGRRVHVGPVTLRARYNAVATAAPSADGDPTVDAGYGAEFVPGATDSRQSSHATGAWTIASAAALAVPGVASITFFESWGPRGVLDAVGRPYPAAEALAQVAELAGAWELEASGLPADVWALAGRTAAGDVALLANLRPTPVTLDVQGAGQVSLEPLSFTRLELSA
jgi:D-apionolactonase